ncbi:MAG: CRTAC1 family protein [bacterium]|nr:CRTAC1 family protein [bacterium]
MVHARRRISPSLHFLAALVLPWLVLCGCQWQPGAASEPIFVDVAPESGLDFVHFNGMSGEIYLCEMMGQGAALFDYDNDGDLDVYLVQGHMLGPGKTTDDALFPLPEPLPLRDRLYRNELTIAADGPRLRFSDVTAESGIAAFGYGMGVAVGDYDNDGWADLYVTNHGPNQLWHNNGDGTFSDVTAATGTDDPRWSTSAAFLDFDRDGWLDLFVASYVDYRVTAHKVCLTPGGFPDYCAPTGYAPEPDRLLRNNGVGTDGRVTFEDHSWRSGIARLPGNGLGVSSADFNDDGWIDLYVANDLMQNYLWLNQGDGQFRNRAMLAGCAVDVRGKGQSSMGVEAADLDNDGDSDLLVTHMVKQSNTLYWNEGRGIFRDGTAESAMGRSSVALTGYGIAMLDYDNDGWLDVMVANGSMTIIESQARAGEPYPLREPNQLFRNPGDGVFVDVSDQAAVLGLSEVSRGLALGDVDNDGDSDVLITNSSGPARLLINQVGHRAHWLGLRLLGKEEKRDMLGARIEVSRPGGPPLRRRVRTDGSYMSAHDPRVLVGLGESAQPVRVRVRWPGGRQEEWSEVAVDRYLTLVRGSGRTFTARGD